MMLRALAALRLRLKRFAADREGVAAVEFALVLPVMLLLYVGSIELSDVISVDRRITVIASTVGDLVARKKGDVYENEINDYFNAAKEIITPYSTTGLKQLITCVFVDGSGVATVQWSRPYGGATAKTQNSTLTLPAEITAISSGKYVIVSETSFSHKPLMGLVFSNALTLYRQNFHLPRYGDNIAYMSGTRP